MFRRYACVRQADQSDCGAAALATVCRHYRRPLPLQQMRDLAGTDRVGTNLLGLVQAAERLGFTARAVKGPFDALAGVPLPAIAHVRTSEGLGHFVVLHRVWPDRVVVADPARGVETLSREAFTAAWTGYLLLLTPDTASQAPVGDEPATAWRRFLALLGGHLPVLGEAVACALLMTLLGVANSYFIQHLVDNVLVRHENRLLNALGVGMALVIVFRSLFGVLRQYLLAHVGRRADMALMSRYSRHLLSLPMQFFDLRRVGEILSRVQDTAKVREAISGASTSAVVDGTLVVALLALLYWQDVPLALLATAFVPLIVLAIIAHHPAAKRRSREAMERASILSAHLVEDVSAVETIKAFGAERRRAEEAEQHLTSFAQSAFSLQKLSVSMGGLATIATATAGLAILWYGGHRVMEGKLTIGELMFFNSLLSYLLDPLERLASLNLRLQDALVAVDRLHQVLDIPAEQAHDARRVSFQGLKHGLELRNVSFRYGCRNNVLDQLNLRIPVGAKVAIVGESGSGKSTLLKLLLGYYVPTEGQLLVDGTDLRDIELGSLRRSIGVVSQEPFVFNGTLRENIALGRPDATMEEIVAATQAAGLAEFVASLPMRYETMIGERGANLSGGQRQRLAIARALLLRPEILIFDEATSHLDVATERAIQENLRTSLAGKTVIVVAHRLSTIRDADQIIVLRHGRIEQTGTHMELLAQAGYYADLCQAQTDTSERRPAAPTLPNHNGRFNHFSWESAVHDA